jgi:hypothetical protein
LDPSNVAKILQAIHKTWYALQFSPGEFQQPPPLKKYLPGEKRLIQELSKLLKIVDKGRGLPYLSPALYCFIVPMRK